MPQYTKEGYEKSQELLSYLKGLAEAKQATQAQISLAWMLGKKNYIIPIPGSYKPERLEENLRAAEVRLSAEEIKKLIKSWIKWIF